MTYNLNNIEVIKRNLQEELKKDSIDFTRILTLANEISLQDVENIRFSIDAGVVNRLGRELVSKKETAVVELIKNAFDADAVKVDVSFSNTDEGEIIVDDNGNGMTEEQVKYGYMRIATDDKVNEPLSPKYNRRRAGRKGIGRFATQRLGRVLQIITQTISSDLALKIIIDWDKFESGKELFEIENHIEKIPKEKISGTTLIISGIRDEWNESEIRSVYSEILELIQPFPVIKNENLENKILLNEHTAEIQNDDFQVNIVSHSNNIADLNIDLTSQVYNYALAEINAYVEDDNFGYVSYRSNRLNSSQNKIQITDEGKPITFKNLQNVALKAYYFIFKNRLIDRTHEKDIVKLADSRGGIRVYRNGFRVSPYGEQGDDWLGLDASSRARKILPPHANINFFGFVELTDTEGKAFEETASREKLIETSEINELVKFTREALLTIVLRIAAIRGKKETPSQKDWNNFAENRKNLRDAVIKLSSTLDEAKSYAHTKKTPSFTVFENLFEAADEAKQKIEKFDKLYNFFQRKSLEEQAMLRILASLGLVIGEFTHEIKQTLDAVELGSKQLLEELIEETEAFSIANELAENIKRFNTYASYFGETVAANADIDLSPQNLDVIVEKFIETIKPIAKSSNIEIKKTLKTSEENLVTCSMHPSEWASILFNLYSNAHKAIIRAGDNGKINIEMSEVERDLYLKFSDNGDGIPETNKNLIFEPFFTTTRKLISSFEENPYIKGAGLGLKIVKDIIVSYGGEIFLDSPQQDYSTTFTIRIPKE